MIIKTKTEDCPYCGSEEIVIYETYTSHDIVEYYCGCETCGRTFWKRYQLVYIETETEDEEEN